MQTQEENGKTLSTEEIQKRVEEANKEKIKELFPGPGKKITADTYTEWDE